MPPLSTCIDPTENGYRKLQGQLVSKENDQRKQVAQLQSQYSIKENEYQKQIAQLRSQQTAQENDHQKQLELVRKVAEAEAEKIRRRTDAEVADLKANISRLEVVLMKVRACYPSRYGVYECSRLTLA